MGWDTRAVAIVLHSMLDDDWVYWGGEDAEKLVKEAREHIASLADYELGLRFAARRTKREGEA